LCPGTTVTLTSSTGTTYKWSTGATTAAISVGAAGSYTDTVYNANGCKAYSAAKVVSYTTAPATPTITTSGSRLRAALLLSVALPRPSRPMRPRPTRR
jgi:hypothetical protein